MFIFSRGAESAAKIKIFPDRQNFLQKISLIIKFSEKTNYSCLRCLFKKEQLHLLDIMLINLKKERKNIFKKISPAVNKFSKIFPDRPVAHTGRFCISDLLSYLFYLFINFRMVKFFLLTEGCNTERLVSMKMINLKEISLQKSPV